MLTHRSGQGKTWLRLWSTPFNLIAVGSVYLNIHGVPERRNTGVIECLDTIILKTK